MTDGTYATGTDQNGNNMGDDPNQNQWDTRIVDLSTYAGKTIQHLWLAPNSLTPAGNWNLYFESIALVSSDSTVIPVYAPGTAASLSISFQGAGITNLSATTEQVSSTTSSNTTTYYHSDHLGSARLISTSQGFPISSATYLPFGQEWNAQPTANHYKFTAKERDGESGLDDFGARYYASSLGRFATPDPIQHPSQSSWDEDVFLGTPQRWNQYSYGLNNPIASVDPNGAEVPQVIGGRLYAGNVRKAESPTGNPVTDTLLLGGIFGGAVVAPEAGIGATLRGLWNAAVGYFLTPQGQQTAQNLAEAVSPPGSNLSIGSAFGFANVEGTIEGFTYGRLANGAEVAANFTKSGANVTASILAAYNPEGVKAAGTLNAILQGAQAVAKGAGATTLTIQALAVTNPKLASLLVKQGFTETTIKVGNETVRAFVKNLKVQ